MKTKIIFVSLSVFLYLSLHISPARAKTIPSIVLSEIQTTGGTNHTDDDFVELYNPNPEPVDISNYRLRYRNSNGTENSLDKIGGNVCIAAHGYYLWANSGGTFSDSADTKTGAGLSSKYSLALLLPDKSENPLIDSVSWESSHPFAESAFVFPSSPQANESMVRDVATGNWLPDFSLTPTPTKSTDTSCPIPPIPSVPPVPPAPTPINSTVRLNEVLPNPKAKGDTGEFIELYNFSTGPTDISGWVLRDATKTGKYVFPSGTIMAAASYLAITDQTFKLSLNNSNETISLFDNADTLIDSVHYEKTKEDVSLNYTATGWRGGKPTPGAVNILNNLPETKERVPKKGYRGVAIDFSARGRDSDRDTLKYTWSFGDGHKSFKEKTSHAYEKNGTYTVILKTTDGKDDAIETFTLKIQNFPHPEIRITSLLPNPAGNDTDHEWILLENREKKTINLKGYSIATGWKSLVSHRINEDFFIKPKKEVKLTRPVSLFTLPNQKGKIELRAPDGKVLQKIKYKLKKPIAENVAYQKKSGARWTFEETTGKNILPPAQNNEADASLTDEIMPPAPVNEEAPPIAPVEDAPKEKDNPQPDQLSLDPDPEPENLLAYRTRIRLLASLNLWPVSPILDRRSKLGAFTLTPPALQNTTFFPETRPNPPSLAESLVLDINASLNALLYRSQEK